MNQKILAYNLFLKQTLKKEAFNDINYQIILNIMEQLDKDERLLIKLRDIDGLSYNEIAEITDLPLGTVKSKLHYARKKT